MIPWKKLRLKYKPIPSNKTIAISSSCEYVSNVTKELTGWLTLFICTASELSRDLFRVKFPIVLVIFTIFIVKSTNILKL